MSSQYDVIIVGNGIIGSSIAFCLKLHDSALRVAVIGPAHYLHGATQAAGAMLGCYGEVTDASFKSKAAITKLEMAIKSTGMWPSWLENINLYLSREEKVSLDKGTFVILNSQAGKRESRNFHAVIHALDRYQAKYEYADPDNIPGLNPVDTHRPLRSIFLPEEGRINPHQLLSALHKMGRETKLYDYHDAVVTQINSAANKTTVTISNGDVYHAPHVVLAAGAYTQQLLDQLPELANSIPPILAGVGNSFLLKHPGHQLTHVIRTPNRAGACGAHFLPFPVNEDYVYLGASNSVRLWPQTHANIGNASYLMHWGMQQFDQQLFKADIININTGNRPVPMDIYPLLGETSIKGLWLASGTFRDGIHDSPLIADLIAREILFKQQAFAHPFQPIRRPIQTMTRAEAIMEVVEHYLSAGHEHGMELPKIGWEFRITSMIESWITDLYEKLDTDYGIAPEILMMLNQTPEAIPAVKNYFAQVAVA